MFILSDNPALNEYTPNAALAFTESSQLNWNDALLNEPFTGDHWDGPLLDDVDLANTESSEDEAEVVDDASDTSLHSDTTITNVDKVPKLPQRPLFADRHPYWIKSLHSNATQFDPLVPCTLCN